MEIVLKRPSGGDEDRVAPLGAERTAGDDQTDLLTHQQSFNNSNNWTWGGVIRSITFSPLLLTPPNVIRSITFSPL